MNNQKLELIEKLKIFKNIFNPDSIIFNKFSITIDRYEKNEITKDDLYLELTQIDDNLEAFDEIREYLYFLHNRILNDTVKKTQIEKEIKIEKLLKEMQEKGYFINKKEIIKIKDLESYKELKINKKETKKEQKTNQLNNKPDNIESGKANIITLSISLILLLISVVLVILMIIDK